MCNFEIYFVEGRPITCSNIRSVTYYRSGTWRTVKEDELLSHDFPVNASLSLHADQRTFNVTGEGIRLIQVTLV